MIRSHSPLSIARHVMASRRCKGTLAGLFFFLALLGASFTSNLYNYNRLMSEGQQAIEENRFDTQAFAQAGKQWFANHDNILFNQGILAYKARNLSHAAQLFRDVSQHGKRDTLRTTATYNLAKVMEDLGEMEGARNLYKEVLRLNAEDMDAKFNLERIQHHLLQQNGEFAQAGLNRYSGQPFTSHPAHKQLRRRKGI